MARFPALVSALNHGQIAALGGVNVVLLELPARFLLRGGISAQPHDIVDRLLGAALHLYRAHLGAHSQAACRREGAGNLFYPAVAFAVDSRLLRHCGYRRQQQQNRNFGKCLHSLSCLKSIGGALSRAGSVPGFKWHPLAAHQSISGISASNARDSVRMYVFLSWPARCCSTSRTLLSARTGCSRWMASARTPGLASLSSASSTASRTRTSCRT